MRGVVDALTTGFGTNVQPAGPGEFTRRAFTNGKMDLLQVESLSDVLQSETSAQKDAALGVYTRGGELIRGWRAGMIAAVARVEAVIDFGEDDEIGAQEVRHAVEDVRMLRDAIVAQLHAVPSAEIVQDGLRVVLLGAPNVGKSSLLNLLLRDDHAIVSPLPGTTRDVLERALDIGGHKVVLVDGAGLREPRRGRQSRHSRQSRQSRQSRSSHDALEAEGMGRIVTRARDAHVVVVMDAYGDDGGDENARVREEVARLAAAGKEMVWVTNKVDLATSSNSSSLSSERRQPSSPSHILMSCRTGAGVDTFLRRLREVVEEKTGQRRGATTMNAETNAETNATVPVMYKARHVKHLRCAVQALERFLGETVERDNDRLELAAEELRVAMAELGEITGAIDLEDVLDDMMRKFCIGK